MPTISVGGGGLDEAAAGTILALARGRLPVFYCVDPHIPGYARSGDFAGATPYEDRQYERRLRLDGCHRYILAEELARRFTCEGAEVLVLELDQTWNRIRQRRCRC